MTEVARQAVKVTLDTPVTFFFTERLWMTLRWHSVWMLVASRAWKIETFKMMRLK